MICLDHMRSAHPSRLWLIFGPLLLLLLPLGLRAQGNSAQLDHFSVQEVAGQVQLDVSLSAGFTCNGIQILRSGDSLQFETIGLFGGFCGDSALAISYRFLDEQPLRNQRSYYTLLLGGRIPTEVLSIQLVDYGQQGFQLRPNPASVGVDLHFRNALQQTYQAALINLQGVTVRQTESNTNQLGLSTVDLPAGLYFILLSNQSTGLVQRGRLLVQH